VVDLFETHEKKAPFHTLTPYDPEGLTVFWHSASHVMAYAVKELYPKAQLGIGPAISNGFYYDFSLELPLSSEELCKIEEKMIEIVSNNESFVRKVISKSEAIELFTKRGENFKLELIQDIPDNEISIYENGQFVDLCRGPHVPSTGFIKHFKLLNVAGSYWHGDERNPVMQRIYGIAFYDKKSLKEYLRKQEEAKKRDHRILGKQLNLFSFHLEGPGFPCWHPKGMIVYNEITNFISKTLNQHKYKEIKTPIILNEELWHKSGHWDNYKENMYFTQIDEEPYAVKPMNCPGCLLIYKNSPHSYKELPIKLAELGLVHRHEKSGVLHGLFRVRQFTQDDAHVFCTPDQMEDEIIKIIDLIAEVYSTFGFEDYNLELSTRPVKSIGTEEIWNMAEKSLLNALKKKNLNFQINKGEGAFYGPKIDYHIRDSLERIWQCGTIQVDFSMPERFGLDYVDTDGEKKRPVMIHRAILGSVERFIGILIEHYGGSFPIWLAPVQCAILPISEKHVEYAQKIYESFFQNEIRCELDKRNEKIGYKIREWETQKVPYMCIVGDNESNNQTISVRKRREGNLGEQQISDFTENILDEIKRRTYH
jgi:threonyl-tRNA synthetase